MEITKLHTPASDCNILITISPKSNSSKISVQGAYLNWCYQKIITPEKIIQVFVRHQHLFVQKSSEKVIILKGEIYDDKHRKDLFDCLAKQRISKSTVSKTNGHFAIFHATIHTEPIVISDRINSHKLFYLNKNKEAIITDSPLSLSLLVQGISMKGLTWYLAGGASYNNRTLLEGVEQFPRATLTSFNNKNINTEQYWDLSFISNNKKCKTDLKNELLLLIYEAVLRRMKTSNYISLSGGYDSSVLLGAMHKLSPYSTNCLTYYYKKTQGNSELKVAENQASLLNENHIKKQIGFCDLNTLIYNNALYSKGISNISDEIEFWLKFKNEHKHLPPIFVGDEFFGWRKENVTKFNEMLCTFKIHDISSLSIYKKIFSKRFFDELTECYHDEIKMIQQKIPKHLSIYDQHNYLYYEFRLCHVLTSWRENYTGLAFDTQLPLLDNNIIDFITTLPEKYRVNKTLFREMANEAFPALFDIERANANRGANIPWKSFLYQNKNILKDLIDHSEIFNSADIKHLFVKPQHCSPYYSYFMKKVNKLKLPGLFSNIARTITPIEQIYATDVLKRFCLIVEFENIFKTQRDEITLHK